MYNNNDDSNNNNNSDNEKEFITATVMSIVSSIDAQLAVNDERFGALQKTLRFEVCEEAYGGSGGEGSYDPERRAHRRTARPAAGGGRDQLRAVR